MARAPGTWKGRLLSLASAACGLAAWGMLQTQQAHASDLYGGGSDLEAELRRLMASEDIEKRRAAVDHLAGLDMRIAAPYLMERLRDSEAGVRARAARALGPGAVAEAAPLLLACLSDVDAGVRAACAEAFGQLGALPPDLQKRAAVTLSRVMSDTQYEVRVEVLRALDRLVRSGGLSVDEQAHLLGPILLRTEDEHVVVRRYAAALLGRLGGLPEGAHKRMAVALLGRLSDPARDVRSEALGSLATLGSDVAAAAAVRLLGDSAEEVRRQAVSYLGRVGYAPAAPLLIDLFERAADPLRQSAARALSQIAGHAAGTQQNGAAATVLAVLIRGLDREEARPAAREAVRSAGATAVPLLLARLATGSGQAGQLEAVVGLIRDLAPTMSGDQRQAAAAELLVELRRARMPREVIVDALATVSGEEGLAPLVSLLSDIDAEVRLHAMRGLCALSRIDSKAQDAVIAASRDGSPLLRAQAAQVLSHLPLAQASGRLRELLQDPVTEVRLAAAQAVSDGAGRTTTAEAGALQGQLDGALIPTLLRVASAPAESPSEVRVRRTAAVALGRLAGLQPGLRTTVTSGVQAAISGLRAAGLKIDLVGALAIALRGAGPVGGSEVTTASALLLDLATAQGEADSDAGQLAMAALDALSALRPPGAAGRVARLLSHAETLRRVRAAGALGDIAAAQPTDSSIGALIAVLQSDRSPLVVAEAAWGLGKLPAQSAGKAIAALRGLLGQRDGMGGDRAVRSNALGALARLGRADVQDAQWLNEGEPAARANAALLLATLPQKSPGMLSRLRALAQTDADHRVRANAQQALRGQGAATSVTRTQFVGMRQVDADRQPLVEQQFRLTLPDGLVRIGVTDRRGNVHEELLPAGMCDVEPLLSSP